MRAVDTNALLRVLVPDDAAQTAAAEEFVEESAAWVSLLALAEAVWVLGKGYGFGPRLQADAVELLLKHRKLVLQDSEAIAAALTLFRARPALGFSDCLMLELARKAGHLPLGIFDCGLARVEGTRRLVG